MKTIRQGLDEAYKNAKENAYFGNGFNAGVEFANKWYSINDTENIEEHMTIIGKDCEGHLSICKGWMIDSMKNYGVIMYRPIDISSSWGFNVDNVKFYKQNDPEKEKTKKRLIQIANCGMVETGEGQFGYKDILSGLYIEMIWSYSDEEFKAYLDWAKELIYKKLYGQEK